MANTASAIKRVRSNERKRIRNRIVRTQARSAIRAAREAISAEELAEAEKAIHAAASALDKAAAKGTIHQNNAARRKSRLMKRLAALRAE